MRSMPSSFADVLRQRRISWPDAQAAVPDLLLCVLFVVAFSRTRSHTT